MRPGTARPASTPPPWCKSAFCACAGRLPMLRFDSRGHFYAYAARVMRSVIVDLVRARAADRRGGGTAHATLDTVRRDWDKARLLLRSMLG